jgi:hypothetical protein
MSWRNSIPIHPSADLFPLLADNDLVALGQDIIKNGMTSPIAITLIKNGAVLIDGRNRLDAIEKVGLRVTLERANTGAWKLLVQEQCDGRWVGKAIAGQAGATVTVVLNNVLEYIESVNVHRRHLTTDQKREVIAKLVERDPERSCRAISAEVGVSKGTVSAVKQELEGRGQIGHVDKVVDTKGRHQPTNKAKSIAKKPNPPRIRPEDEELAASIRNQQSKPIAPPPTAPVATAPPTAPAQPEPSGPAPLPSLDEMMRVMMLEPESPCDGATVTWMNRRAAMALDILVRAQDRLHPLKDLLAPDQLCEKKKLDDLITSLQALNKIMAQRRKAQREQAKKVKAESKRHA